MVNRPNDPLLNAPPQARAPSGHVILFVLFVLIAFCLFAPTIHLPLLNEHTALLEEEQRLAVRCRELNQEIQRHETLVKAFQTDPAINERLAVLDLRYQKPDELVVPILRPDMSTEPVDVMVDPNRPALWLPHSWPKPIHLAADWAEDKGLIAIYLDSSLRPALLLMAAGLTIAAFILFGPRDRRMSKTQSNHNARLAARRLTA